MASDSCLLRRHWRRCPRWLRPLVLARARAGIQGTEVCASGLLGGELCANGSDEAVVLQKERLHLARRVKAHGGRDGGDGVRAANVADVVAHLQIYAEKREAAARMGLVLGPRWRRKGERVQGERANSDGLPAPQSSLSRFCFRRASRHDEAPPHTQEPAGQRTHLHHDDAANCVGMMKITWPYHSASSCARE
eukprot:6189125-Pleurochrysis_carterae.AAC.1